MLLKKKGFTLIELMIVLAIIAILGVVLIPKSSIFKTQARNSGIYTNINSIRAYLENKTEDQFISNPTTLKSSLDAAFTGDDDLKNPLDNNAADYVVSTTEPTTLTKGSVVVLVDSTNKKYTIYGIDNGNQKINTITIK